MSVSNRPLSPHLQIYRLPLLAVLSITHRLTGVCLSVGFALLPLLLIAIANGPESYTVAQTHLSAWYGQIFLFLFTLALNFHLLNGIRHLFWDAGLNLRVEDAERSAFVLLGILLVITAGIWLLA